MSLIGIVTVLYNSEKVLEDYFRSLSEQTFQNFTLYVVDNLSPDNSLSKSYELAKEYKNYFKTVIIENKSNDGVARGNNIGIKKALEDHELDYILLSNNDVVLNPDTIELLVLGMKNNKIDMSVPKIYFYDEDLIWYAGGKFRHYLGSTIHTGYLKHDEGKWDEFKLVDYAPTCFILIKKEIFETVGFFDEKYFVYYDDTDWIYRCLKNRKKIGYIFDSTLEHKESTSTGGMQSDFYIKYNYRNQAYFCKKNYNFLQNVVVSICNFLYYILIKRKSFNKLQKKLLKEAIKNGLRM